MIGLAECIVEKYERAAWVRAAAESTDAYYRPGIAEGSPQPIALAVVTDPAVLARIDSGMVQQGSVLAYARSRYASTIQPRARVWWDDEANSTGVSYEIVSLEQYLSGAVGRLGGFVRVILKRVEV